MYLICKQTKIEFKYKIFSNAKIVVLIVLIYVWFELDGLGRLLKGVNIDDDDTTVEPFF